MQHTGFKRYLGNRVEQNRLHIELSSKLEDISLFQMRWETFSETHNISQKDSFQTMLVLDELLTNVINYSSATQIRLDIKLITDCLHICLKDDGAPFNPLTETAVPDLTANIEDRRIGGLGVHIAKTMMETLDYRFENGQNILSLVKKLGTSQ